MSYGCSGPHRSGKSTVARSIAEKTGFAALPFDTTTIVGELGLSPVADHDLETRFRIQDHLLERFWEISQNTPRPFISDRTPLDMAAYMYGEVTMNNTSVELGQRIDNYAYRCLKAVRNTYLGIFVLCALDGYEVNSNKPPPNRGYQSEHHLLVLGLSTLIGPNGPVAFTVGETDHEKRLDYIFRRMIEVGQIAQAERDAAPLC